MKSDIVLEARGVTRDYQVSRGLFGERAMLRAVDGVNLTVARREIVALVGESGCGKSTLSRLLLGLEAPSQGTIRIDGRALETLRPKERARLVQPVFQDPYGSLNPSKTISQIIGLPLEIQGNHDAATRRELIADMLDHVGLPAAFADRFPRQLSGGQRQRVAIARALITRPTAVICDEPTSALDVSVQAQLQNLLIDLRDEFGLTYLLITHDLATVRHMADRVAVMYLGRIIEEAATEQLFANPRHPYTKALIGSALTPDPTLPLPELNLGTAFPDPINRPPGCAFHPRCPAARAQCRQHPPHAVRFSGGFVECHLHTEDPREELQNEA